MQHVRCIYENFSLLKSIPHSQNISQYYIFLFIHNLSLLITHKAIDFLSITLTFPIIFPENKILTNEFLKKHNEKNKFTKTKMSADTFFLLILKNLIKDSHMKLSSSVFS